jgi:transmembrane sensor
LENNPNSNVEYSLYISSLIHRLREKEVLNEQEMKDLDEWRKPGGREEVFQELMDRKRFVAGMKEMNNYDGEAAVNTIFSLLGLRTPLQVRRMVSLKRGMAVAAVFLLAVTGVWLLVKQRPAPPAGIVKKDVGPGGNKATLTLANGTTIQLDTVQRGAITRQGNSRVLKMDDGRLAYEPVTKKTESPVYNTLSTPRGGQYQLTLPDGSRVWLNAASSITYPTAFTNAEQRNVKITGEVYIDVVHGVNRPFRVEAGGQLIEVLGTAFNVNAYADEPVVSTTLVEGKIKVSRGKVSRMLSPGQQVQSRQAQGEGALEMAAGVDVDQVLAWKNGAFSFRNADLPTVMRQLARWYDIEVEYTGAIPAGTFDGEIGRGLTLNQVLQGLAQARINYTIVNSHKIVIRP